MSDLNNEVVMESEEVDKDTLEKMRALAQFNTFRLKMMSETANKLNHVHNKMSNAIHNFVSSHDKKKDEKDDKEDKKEGEKS